MNGALNQIPTTGLYVRRRTDQRDRSFVQNPVEQRGDTTDHRKQWLNRRDELRILEVREYLELNYLQPLTLKQICRTFGINDFKLKLGFRLQFNTTVFNFLATLRMEYAQWAIAEGMPIKEVSDTLHYSAPRHFSSAFKKRFGFLPKELKKSNQAACHFHSQIESAAA